MKEQIRKKVFETNSSSVHSLTMCSMTEYEKWKKGELVYDECSESLVEIPAITEEEKENAKNEYINSATEFHLSWDELSDDLKEKIYRNYYERRIGFSEYLTYDKYWEKVEDYYETFEEIHNTETETIIAFGYYGNDY